ncbi:MAG: hypothetical protein A2992_04375 [Elusimicrobia bacterium RIFCSPLOWO2_01_FULL_59_12]|nr:MAG: hypothetical protein A2992_04375 [Elusimicrobia bacterium RIFCSPLOWO2_01_FULL_59_12]
MADKSTSHWPISLTNGFAAVLNLFLPLVLVRILTPDQMGQYKIFFLYVMISPGLFLLSGLSNGLYHWVGKYPDTKPEVRQSWTLLVVISLLLCAIGLILSPWIAPLIRIPLADLRLFLMAMPFGLASEFLEDLLIARGKIWTGSFYSSGANVLRGVSLLAAAWWTRSIEWVILVFVAGALIRTLIGWLLLFKTGDIQPLFSRDKSVKVLRYALPVSIAALAGVVLQNLDQLILSVRLSPEAFAFYAMGCLMIPPLFVFEISVNRVLIPRLSQAFAAKDKTHAAALFSESVSELFRFLLPATIGLMIFSDPIVRILFTERYMPAVPFMRVYALYYLCFALPYDSVARALGDGKWILRAALLFAPFSIGATWLAVGHWGAMGALIAFLATQFTIRLYSLDHQRRSFAVTYSKFLPFKDMGVQAGLAAAAGAFAVLSRPLFSDPRMWFFVTGPIFMVIYFGGAYAVYLRKRSAHPATIHVLELAQTLGLGGLERMVYSLAQELHQRPGFKVLVATYDHQGGDPSLETQFREAGIPLVQWQKRKGFSLRSVVRLLQIIFSNDTRVLHVHDLGPLIYGSIAKVLSLGHVRLFVTLHTLLDIQHNRRYRFYYRFFLRFPDRIIAVSTGVKSGLVALGIRPQRIEVIPNGVAFSLSSLVSNIPLEKQTLRKRLMPGLAPHLYAGRWMLCLARLHAGKGQDLVLDIWRALSKEARAELSLFFVGQETQAGYREYLDQKILDLPDRERLFIAGPSEHPQDWIQASDLFISGSLLEGMPLAPLEAAGSGLPTILSDIEGHRFLSPWAHYFDVKKPEEGAQRILEILATLKTAGETKFFDDRWGAAAALRKRWDTPTMAASYAETFQFN